MPRTRRKRTTRKRTTRPRVKKRALTMGDVRDCLARCTRLSDEAQEKAEEYLRLAARAMARHRGYAAKARRYSDRLRDLITAGVVPGDVARTPARDLSIPPASDTNG